MQNKIKPNKTKYDVISISHFFYPRVGGLENMAYNVIKDLSNRGLKCISIYGNDRNLKNRADNFDWVSFKCFKIFNNTYPLFGLKFTAYVFKTIKNNRDATILIYDRHLTSSFITALICKLLNHKYIIVAQTTTSNYFKNKVFENVANFLDQKIFKKVLNGAEIIISVSESTRKFLINEFEADPRKIHIIYNVFNEELVKKFKGQKKERIVVFATKFIPVKDPNTTARAFLAIAEKYPKWRFVFAGKGDTILQDKKDLPENFDFTPRFLPQLDLFNLLGKSAIYVNSSLNEGLSLGVIEAAGLGNIAVLSDAPSNLEIAKKLEVEEYAFERGNDEDLAFKIELAISQFEKDKKGKIGLEISEKTYANFSSEKLLNNYFKLIQNFSLIYNKAVKKKFKTSFKLSILND